MDYEMLASKYYVFRWIHKIDNTSLMCIISHIILSKSLPWMFMKLYVNEHKYLHQFFHVKLSRHILKQFLYSCEIWYPV